MECEFCLNRVFPVINILEKDPGDYGRYLAERTGLFLVRASALYTYLLSEKKKSYKWGISTKDFFMLAKPNSPKVVSSKTQWVTQIFDGEERYAGVCDRDFCVFDTWLSKSAKECQYV